jgi:hypothetical protein
MICINKKFWEELVTYFDIDMLHIENDASSNSLVAYEFVALETRLPRHCLAKIGE